MILSTIRRCISGKMQMLAAFFAPFHDGFVEAVAKSRRHLVDLVGAIDLDGFAGSVQRDLAVLAALQMLLEIGAHLAGDAVVDQVVEHGQKLSARHS